ncbi:MAG: hypothetical protein R3F24_10025 [Gammaproteobacteria bacterium]
MNKNITCHAVLATIVLVQAPMALAQSESGGLEEITVTARKQSETLQDVPLQFPRSQRRI